ncbi:LysE family translocator [Rosenbergiella sp. S61]|uniref:LysE family translocator n=1 Tax=Rosenbergiella gaditana TaxID=2726987 RepID=A0ABS5SZA4_9GAMM|nr:LysE family translocator [Rosenbergiella gaditana]MBT0724547.1 LysE family translocator [Rosenbergiella gaditana]
MVEWSLITPALLVYSLGTLTPGPANLSIANLAMSQGRQAGFILAAGVITGSLCWGVMTALGVSTLLLSEPRFLLALKFLGAVYLFWLAYKAIKSLAVPLRPTTKVSRADHKDFRYYWQGVSLHLTNPKAILTWLTVTSIGLSPHSTPWATVLLVILCALIGMTIFSLYAFCFSTSRAQQILVRYHRLITLFCAGFYTLVAIGFLLSIG